MTNKLTIEEKKIIAEEVRGWVIVTNGTQIMTEGGKGMPLSSFNPDQDTPKGLTQFVEMIEVLDIYQKTRVTSWLNNNNQEYHDRDFGLDGLDWLCSHKYEVCQAVIEVVK